MALITADEVKSIQGIVRVFRFPTTLIDDVDTFEGPSKGDFWITNNTDNVVVSAARSSSTYTFTVASSGTNKDCTLFVTE